MVSSEKLSNTKGSNSVPKVNMLINGKFIESETQYWENIPNPLTQKTLAQVPFSTTEEIDNAVNAAKEAFSTWHKTPISSRARIFFKLQQLIRDNLDRLSDSITA